MQPDTVVSEVGLEDFSEELVRELGKIVEAVIRDGSTVFFIEECFSPEKSGDIFSNCRDELKKGKLTFFIARSTQTGQVVGTIQLGRHTSPNGHHRADVRRFMVLPEFQGTGVGRKLYKALEDKAKSTGVELLLLDTTAGSAAERFYTKSGWKSIGVCPGYAYKFANDEKEAATFMYKEL